MLFGSDTAVKIVSSHASFQEKIFSSQQGNLEAEVGFGGGGWGGPYFNGMPTGE